MIINGKVNDLNIDLYNVLPLTRLSGLVSETCGYVYELYLNCDK